MSLLLFSRLLFCLCLYFFVSAHGISCVDRKGISEQECLFKMKHCEMKWTQACLGSSSPGIGHCHCVGYCGYDCPKACIEDAECTWDFSQSICKNKNPAVLNDHSPYCRIKPVSCAIPKNPPPNTCFGYCPNRACQCYGEETNSTVGFCSSTEVFCEKATPCLTDYDCSLKEKCLQSCCDGRKVCLSVKGCKF